MKKNELKEYKNKSVKDLLLEADKLHKEIAKITVEKTTAKDKKTDLIGKRKKALAVVLTFIRQKELEIK